MWHMVQFADSKIKRHITLAKYAAEVTDDIVARYNTSVIGTREIEKIALDPGGMVFLDSTPLEFMCDGYNFIVRPEHIESVLIMLSRAKPMKNDLIRIYGEYNVVVIPKEWVEWVRTALETNVRYSHEVIETKMNQLLEDKQAAEAK